MFVGLVYERRWEPDDEPTPRGEWAWHVHWRSLGWVAAFAGLMALVPVAETLFGGLVSFGVLMLAVALGIWRVERWCAKQYWHGLREYQS